jgi:anaerobic ribonucleoside-triphosphate reductase activating protein
MKDTGRNENIRACLRLYAQVAATQTLGPFSRYALWVQGCPFRCPGCMTLDAQPFAGGYTADIPTVAEAVLSQPGIEGITISGGEPFTQAAALADMLDLVHGERDLGVVVYSGYTLPQLAERARSDAEVGALLSRVDLLIDGPYMAQCDDGGALRGSANQGVHFLTPRYRDFAGLYQPHQPRRVEVHVTEKELMLVGVPSVRQLDWWQTKKSARGVENEQGTFFYTSSEGRI